ncbi:aminoglycoside 6-adenylyltransferase, partial [Streptococcus hyovaginalis]
MKNNKGSGKMDLVLSLAEQDERIRIVTLEGSRANINIPKDE